MGDGHPQHTQERRAACGKSGGRSSPADQDLEQRKEEAPAHGRLHQVAGGLQGAQHRARPRWAGGSGSGSRPSGGRTRYCRAAAVQDKIWYYSVTYFWLTMPHHSVVIMKKL